MDGSGNFVGTPVTVSYTYYANGNKSTQVRTRTANAGTQTITTAYAYGAQNRLLTTTVSTGAAPVKGFLISSYRRQPPGLAAPAKESPKHPLAVRVNNRLGRIW